MQTTPAAAGIARGAERIVRELAGVSHGLRVVLVSDETSDPTALAAINAALDASSVRSERLTARSFLSGRRSPMNLDVIVSVAAPLLTHSDEMRLHLSAGARYINLRGLNSELLVEASQTDFDMVHEMTHSLAVRMSAARDARVRNRAGTDLQLRLTGDVLALSGVARQAGEIGGYPGGEVALVPVRGSVNGTIRSPIFIEGLTGDVSGTTIDVSESVAVIDTETAASLDPQSPLVSDEAAGRTVGEFGLGTNGSVGPSIARGAKKRLGMAHFGIGDNRTFGGDNAAAAHVDVILADPSVTVDGELLIDRGVFTWSP